MKKYDVVIIGAGTAGLTARKSVAMETDNYIVVDDGPLGTTCARVGCMPSKVLIQAANDFERRKSLEKMGIHGGVNLNVDPAQVMKHVRTLRDRFTGGVMKSMKSWENKLLRKRAKFVDSHTLDVGGEQITADKFIIATGSTPIIPKPWLKFKDHLIDTNDFFELQTLPKKMVVIGLGVIGTELGQAINRLGVETVGITMGKVIGGITDPILQEYVAKAMAEEMQLHFNGANLIGLSEDGLLKVEADDKVYEVEKALVAIGRRPNIDSLGLENLNIQRNTAGIPEYNKNTMSLKEAPHIYLAGDTNGERPLLHEAADEGRIAGYNAVNDEVCFKRRVSLAITFSDPNIATVGKRYDQLKKEMVEFVTGKVSFEGQGRSIVKLKEKGLMHIYAQKNTGNILGAELFCPEGEHLAHLIAWAISLNLSVFEALKLPFYHPAIEEGLRTALRDCAKQVHDGKSHLELFRCDDSPIR